MEQISAEHFIESTKNTASASLLEVSDGGKRTERTYDFDGKYANVIIIRGGAIEKAVIYHLKFKGLQSPATYDRSSGEVFQMEIFPENPCCPMGHLSTEWVGGTPYSMNLDLFPAVKISQDLEQIRDSMNKVADRFSLDKMKMREGQDIQYNMSHFNEPLAQKVGCKLRQLSDKDVEMFIALHQAFLNGYFEILAERKHEPFGNEEICLKMIRNGKWLEYFVLKDGAVKSALENNFPPELLIDIGFPPIAAF